MLSPYVAYYGEDRPPPRRVPLRAGPLTLVYEAGDLRTVKLGDSEVLRRVYVAVRDRHWGTIIPVLTDERIEDLGDGFIVSYTATHRQGDIDFVWQAELRGAADGSLTFSMDGVARSTFWRNRLGFCVLHPASAAGAACRIRHVDGTVETATLPVAIAPQRVENGVIHPVYPFADMAALAHEVAPGAWAEVTFEGEVFELEDQRNWTDGSFKTYGTPLRLPFPAEVQAGTHLQQRVTLRLLGEAARAVPVVAPSATAGIITVAVRHDAPAHPLPRLGLGMASHGQPLRPREIQRLRALRLAHLRLDLPLAQPDAEARLRQAADEARAVGARLEVALFLTDDAEQQLTTLRRWLAETTPPLARWLVFGEGQATTEADLARLAHRRLAEFGAPIVGGTNANFTELNRGRPALDDLDGLCYSVNPQVHAFDTASLAETPPVIATTVTSARRFSQGRAVHVTPVTLKPRFNAAATGPEPPPPPGELPPQVDPRQMSLFGAGWTLAALKYLAEGGAASATYYETTGWRGVMATEAGSPLPERFPSLPGAAFPVYHVLADVADFVDGEALPAVSSDPLAVEGMAVRHGGRTAVLLANLTAEPREVRVAVDAARARLRLLDETTIDEAMRAPERYRAAPPARLTGQNGALVVALRPYAVARLDLEAEGDT